MKVKSFGMTHVGLKRSENQDHFILLPEITNELGLFLIADGMGGHRGGQTASHLASETVANFFLTNKEKLASSKLSDLKAHLETAFKESNELIYQTALKNPDLHGMGTTLTCLIITPNAALIGHVGDSRAYLFQNQKMWQITRDHSLVQERLRAGLITRDEVKTDRNKNVITRSVGFEPKVEIDIYELDFKPNDLILLCSDGLYGLVEDPEILVTINDSFGDLEKTSSELIKSANNNGGDDNVTTILVHYV